VSEPAVGARAVACARIRAQVPRFPRLAFDARDSRGADGAGHLDSRDSALADAIEQCTLRHWLAIECVVRAHVQRPWLTVQAPVRAALMTGAAQLLFFDRLPAHAVVDETVGWVKSELHRGAAGVVNAVLRAVAALRSGAQEAPDPVRASEPSAIARWSGRRDALPADDGRVIMLGREVLPADPAERLSVQTSHARALVAHWRQTLGPERALAVAAHGLCRPPTVIALGDGAASASADPDVDACVHLAPHREPGFAIWTGPHQALEPWLAANPRARVQDPASAAPVAALAAHCASRSERPRTILDACAGRGTKTLQLALAFPDSQVIATDPDEQRMRALRARCAAHANVRVVDTADLGPLAGTVDIALLDVPCTNTGTLARRLEARYRWSDDELRALRRMQREIAEHHAALLDRSVAGRAAILWSTCSVDPTENREQASWIAQMSRGSIEMESMRWPSGLPGSDPAGYSDGSYHALVRLG
jgi:16S rRNA (cytosine967-C5)-methyltransferase